MELTLVEAPRNGWQIWVVGSVGSAGAHRVTRFLAAVPSCKGPGYSGPLPRPPPFIPPTSSSPGFPRRPDLRVLADMGCPPADLGSRLGEVYRRDRVCGLQALTADPATQALFPPYPAGAPGPQCRPRRLLLRCSPAPVYLRSLSPSRVLPTKGDFQEGFLSMPTVQVLALSLGQCGSSAQLVSSWTRGSHCASLCPVFFKHWEYWVH